MYREGRPTRGREARMGRARVRDAEKGENKPVNDPPVKRVGIGL